MSDLYGQEYDPEVNLWVAKSADAMAREQAEGSFVRGMLKRRKRKRTIYNQYGRPIAQIVMSDSGNTEHEFDHHQDAIARPLPARPRVRVR